MVIIKEEEKEFIVKYREDKREAYVLIWISLPSKYAGRKVKVKYTVELIEEKILEKDFSKLLQILIRTYWEIASKKCEPVLTRIDLLHETSEKRGIYYKFNENLVSIGLKPLSWEEFKEFMLKVSEDPRFFGKIVVSWFIAKTNQIEPMTIAICSDEISM